MKATPAQLAAYVGKSERTIHRYLASGRWPHKKLPGGLIEIDDALLLGPENEQENALSARLARIERKLDDLTARVAMLSETDRPAARHVPAAATVASDMPPGLVGWRQFAALHGIAATTVHEAIERGELPVIAGSWVVGKAPVKQAFDARGRRAFYERYHELGRFTPCPECPH